jgi:hypothetical protein
MTLASKAAAIALGTAAFAGGMTWSGFGPRHLPVSTRKRKRGSDGL